MSLYVSVQGILTYPNQDRLNYVVDMLTRNGWMRDNKFVDENDNFYQDVGPNGDIDGLTLNIPLGLYRNLLRVMEDIVQGTSGRLTWTCSDGCLDAGVIKDGIEENYDLEEWLAEQHETAVEGLPSVEKPDFSEDNDDFSDWVFDVEMCFHEMMGC